EAEPVTQPTVGGPGSHAFLPIVRQNARGEEISDTRPDARVSGAGRLEVEIPAGGAMLAASVSLPEELPAPAVVALHGASEGTRDGQLYTHLHRALPSAGFAVATFDRRGEGASTGDPSRGRFAQQAADALAVVDYVGAL